MLLTLRGKTIVNLLLKKEPMSIFFILNDTESELTA